MPWAIQRRKVSVDPFWISVAGAVCSAAAPAAQVAERFQRVPVAGVMHHQVFVFLVEKTGWSVPTEFPVPGPRAASRAMIRSRSGPLVAGSGGDDRTLPPLPGIPASVAGSGAPRFPSAATLVAGGREAWCRTVAGAVQVAAGVPAGDGEIEDHSGARVSAGQAGDRDSDWAIVQNDAPGWGGRSGGIPAAAPVETEAAHAEIAGAAPAMAVALQSAVGAATGNVAVVALTANADVAPIVSANYAMGKGANDSGSGQ